MNGVGRPAGALLRDHAGAIVAGVVLLGLWFALGSSPCRAVLAARAALVVNPGDQDARRQLDKYGPRCEALAGAQRRRGQFTEAADSYHALENPCPGLIGFSESRRKEPDNDVVRSAYTTFRAACVAIAPNLPTIDAIRVYEQADLPCDAFDRATRGAPDRVAELRSRCQTAAQTHVQSGALDEAARDFKLLADPCGGLRAFVANGGKAAQPQVQRFVGDLESSGEQLERSRRWNDAMAAFSCVLDSVAESGRSVGGRLRVLGHILSERADLATMAQRFGEHTSDVTGVAFSPDGSWIVSGDASGQIVKWNIEGLVLVRWDQRRPVNDLALSPDGRWVAAGASDGVRVWRSDGPFVSSLGFGRPVEAVAFNQDGSWLVVGSGEMIHVLAVSTAGELSVIERLRVHNADGNVHVTQLAMLDNSTIASATWRGVTVWKEGLRSATRLVHGDTDVAFAVQPGTYQIVSGGDRDRELKYWDAATECTYPSRERREAVQNHLAGGEFSVIDVCVLTSAQRQTPTAARVAALAFHPSGMIIAEASFDQTIDILESSTGATLHRLQGHDAIATAIAFSRDGRWLVTAGQRGSALLWRLPQAIPGP